MLFADAAVEHDLQVEPDGVLAALFVARFLCGRLDDSKHALAELCERSELARLSVGAALSVGKADRVQGVPTFLLQDDLSPALQRIQSAPNQLASLRLVRDSGRVVGVLAVEGVERPSGYVLDRASREQVLDVLFDIGLVAASGRHGRLPSSWRVFAERKK